MIETLRRLLIINDQRDFACRFGAIAERQKFSVRILTHTLDLEYVMAHWRPDIIAVHMAMTEDQDVHALGYLEQVRFRGRLLLTGDVSRSALEAAAEVGRQHGLVVVSVLTETTPSNKIQEALKALLRFERAA